jgi:subtilisin family serine protease
MKREILIIILGFFYSLSLSAQQESDHFYYYFGEKIFLKQRTDKIYFDFAPNVSEEQLHSLIRSDASLKPAADIRLEEGSLRFAILEAKEGKQITSTAVQTLKSRPEIVWASYMYQCNEMLIGLTNDFVVKLKETTSYEQLKKLTEQNHCTIGEENRYVKDQFMLYVSKVSELNTLQLSNLFYETGLFEFASPNFFILNAGSNGTFFGQQWGLSNTGQSGGTSGIDVKASQAWAITRGSPNIRIAVIDNGIDLTHPDLQTNLLLPGFDATGQNSGGAPFQNDDSHGTACAGIAGARGVGISGVAQNCRIIPIRAYRGPSDVNTFVPDAINEAVIRGADIISHSWNGPFHQPTANAINNAVANGREGLGVIFVNSSGNNNSAVTFPANLDNVIAVGAINRNGQRANFSNFGVALDVMAPGVDVHTTDRQGSAGYNTSNGTAGNYTTQTGTSFAAPHVAGIAALILSVRPDLNALQVRNAIETTCRRLSAHPATGTGQNGRPRDNHTGYGLVDAYAAVYSVATRIEGPSIICSGSPKTFTVANAPTGFHWGSSSNLTRNSSSGNSASFTATGSSTTGWISVMLGAAELARYQVNVVHHAPVISYIDGPLFDWTSNLFTAILSSGSPPLYYDWTMPSDQLQYVDLVGNGFDYIRIHFFEAGEYSLYLKVTNACGVSYDYISIYVSQSGFSFYPNPASDILNIEIDPQASANTKALALNVTDVRSLKNDPEYDLRLYDHQGNLLRQAATKGSTVQFNVSNLPVGIYYLHIYDGVSNKPEIRQIVVER